MATEIRELTCINCPLGCQLSVTIADGEVTSVTGNTCKRGDSYGRTEVTDPRRTVTSSVPVVGSETERMLSVKTAAPVPKALVFKVVEELADVTATAPVAIGDVVVANICDTGVDIIATRDA